MLAVGTETDGSITCPSSVNGIVGIKPSVGTVSRQGIIPLAHSQDTAGPMARTVSDAVLLLDVIVGADKADTATVETQTNYSQYLQIDGLHGKRIGIASNMLGNNPDVIKLFNEAVNTLKQQGAIIIDNVEIPNMGKLGQYEYTILLYEFKHGLNAYFEAANIDLTLEELINFNIENKHLEMPFFGQEIFIQAQAKGSLEEKEYLNALKQAKSLSGKEGLDLIIKRFDLDLLIAPTDQPAWKIDWVTGDNFQFSASTPAAVSGYPHITVPMGFVHHLPVGLSFFGENLSEGKLIEAAFSYEQSTKHRVAPSL